MSDRLEEDLMEDLSYGGAEGSTEMLDEGAGFEDFDAAAEAEDFGGEDWEGAGEEFLTDDLEGADLEGEAFDDFGDDGAFADEEALESVMAYALGAEDADEFFRRIVRGVRSLARRVAPVIGSVARTAAPIASGLGRVASMIPHPYAQVAGRVLGGAQPILRLLGQLRAEGASEDEVLDAFAELAAYDEQVRPIVSGLAARALVRGRGAQLPKQARRILVRSLGSAARTITQQRGPRAIRALPRIVRSVRRTAAVKKTPLRVMPRVVGRTAANVARSTALTQRLAQPSPTAVKRVRPILARVAAAGAAPRSFVLRGPVRISITSA